MTRPRIASALVGSAVLTAALLLAGCGGGEGEGPDSAGSVQDPGRDDTVEGVVEVLAILAPALADGNGPRACSLLAAEAQRQLENVTGTANCINAVTSVASTIEPGDRRTLTAGGDWKASIADDVATVTGASAQALVRVFETEELRLTRVEGRWAVAGEEQ